MNSNMTCPACGSTDVKKLLYTPQGGILWTPFLNFIKCGNCKVRFSGKTGELDPQVPKMMRILSVVVILGFLGLLVGFALSLSSMRTTKTSPAEAPPRFTPPSPPLR